MTRMNVASGLLIVVVAGVAFVLLLARRKTDHEAGGTDQRGAASQSPGESLHGPRLVGVPPRPGSTAGATSGWRLRVHLDGLRPGEESDARVSVAGQTRMGQDGPLVEAAPAPSSSLVELDVTPLVERSPGVHTLVVTARAPMSLSVETALGLPEDEQQRSAGGVLEVRLTLVTAAVLRGRMLGPDGLPRQGLIQALMDPRTSSPARGWSSEADESGPDGTFRCLVPGPEEVVLALRATLPDSGPGALLPALTGPWRVSVGQVTDVGDLRLESGLVLPGLVEGDTRLGDMTVSAHWLTPRVFVGPGHELWGWSAEGCARQVQAELAAGERVFALEPLRRGRWQVALQGLDWGCALSHAIQWTAHRVVEVPGEQVVFDARRSLLRVIVTSSGAPLDGATVVLEADHALSFRADSVGHGAVVFPARTHVRAQAWAKGYVARSEGIVTPAEGLERTLRLDLARATGLEASPEGWGWALHPVVRTTVQVSSAAGLESLPGARLRLLDEHGTRIPATWIEQANVVTWRTDERLVGISGAACISDLPPGPLWVEVEAPGHVTQRVELLRPAGAPGGALDLNVVLEPN